MSLQYCGVLIKSKFKMTLFMYKMRKTSFFKQFEGEGVFLGFKTQINLDKCHIRISTPLIYVKS